MLDILGIKVAEANITGGWFWLQVLVDGMVTTVVLDNLTPLTEYVINVYAVVSEVDSEPLKGTETTCK